MLMRSIDIYNELELSERHLIRQGYPSFTERVNRIIKEIRTESMRGVPYWPYFTLHDLAHSERVLENAQKLLTPIYSLSDQRFRLNTTECFILLCSAYLHDIGMFVPFSQMDIDLIRGDGYEKRGDYRKYEGLAEAIEKDDKHFFQENQKLLASFLREAHHHRSADAIRARKSILDISEEADFIARVSEGHRRENLYNGLFQPARLGMEVVRRDFLSAIIRFADELDILRLRVPNALNIINDRAVNNITKKNWYRHYSVSGYSIDINEKNNIVITINTIQHESKLTEYINNRMPGFVGDPIQEELSYIDNILKVNHLVVERSIEVVPIPLEDQRIKERDVAGKDLCNIFNEQEFVFRCPALSVWSKRIDKNVRVLKEGDLFVCLLDKDEHIGSKNYCMFDCGFCYKIPSQIAKSENEFDFFCPIYSKNPKFDLQHIKLTDTGRWGCIGHVPLNGANRGCGDCNRRSVCNQDEESCICKECGFYTASNKEWQHIIR